MNRNLVGCIILAAGCSLVAASARAPTQWALVIGIDDYLFFDDADGGDLRGAEADATRMMDAFRTVFDVPADNIITLLGAAATRDSIEFILAHWLPERVGPGDRVLIYYSGHGAQVLDQNGDEADGLDEVICPVDVLPRSADKDIRDDDLRRWLGALRAREKIVILDSCHSGTATRAGLAYARSRKLVRDSLPMSTPLVDIQGRGDDLDEMPGVVELSAAAAGQMAWEVEVSPAEGLSGRYGGVFTTKLLRKIRSLPRHASIEDLYWATFHAVKAEGFVQDPQRSGPAEAVRIRASPPPLTTSAGLTTRYRVVDASPDGALVAWNSPGPFAGALLVSPEGAALEVASVDGAGIHGRVLAGRLQVGQELATVGMRLDMPQVVVVVGDDGVRGPVVTALSRAPGTRVRRGVIDGATFTLVGSSTGDSVLVLGLDGATRFGVPREGRPADLERLRQWLAVERGRLLVARLANPVEPFGLTLRPRSPSPMRRVNDPMELSVYSEVAGYLTLVNLDPDGALTVLVPTRTSGPVTLQAGTEISLPDSRTDLTLRTSSLQGRGTLVAIVTNDPLEFAYGPSGFALVERNQDFIEAMARAIPLRRTALGMGEASRAFVNLDSWNSTVMTYQIGDMSKDLK